MQKVLVVIDMQKDFVDGALGSAQAQLIVDNVRQKIENFDGPIIFTLVGLCTDICVVSNAIILKAGLPEIPVYVDSSCCAGVTEESHQAALTTMKMCQCIID